MGTKYGKADLNPAEWKWMGCFYQGNSDDIAYSYQDDERELAENLVGDPYADLDEAMSGVIFHENGGCASCGAHFAHGAVYERLWCIRCNLPLTLDGFGTYIDSSDGDACGVSDDSGIDHDTHLPERIAVGHTCGAEYFGLDSIAALRTKQAAERRERRELREQWEAQLTDNPEFAAAIEWGTTLVCSFCNQQLTERDPDSGDYRDVTGSIACPGRKRDDYTNHTVFARDSFIEDVARKGRRYGSSSDRQIEAVIRAHAKGLEREAEKARRAAADADAESCPEGKHTITGTVLSSDYRENTFSHYGEQIPKMLVRDDRGFKVWGTVPASILRIEKDGHVMEELPNKGERVTFTATIEPSKDDRLFGFFKRPSKAERLES